MFDSSALLSGATGSLGLGGGVGTSIPSGPSSSASSQSGDISPSIGGISGGATDLRQNISIAFPNARLSASSDVNPPLLGGGNFVIVALGIGALFMFIFLFRR